MTKPLSLDLRERLISAVDDGMTRRATTKHHAPLIWWRGLPEGVMRKPITMVARLVLSAAVMAVGVFIVAFLKVDLDYILMGLLVAMYLSYETKIQQLSADLYMVESLLIEKFPSEFSLDQFRRRF